MEPEKHRRKLLHVTLHKFAQIFNQATDWPHLNFNVINALYRNSGRKNWAETRSRYGATDFVFYPSVPCVSASHTPAFPVPLSQIRHCSIVK